MFFDQYNRNTLFCVCSCTHLPLRCNRALGLWTFKISNRPSAPIASAIDDRWLLIPDSQQNMQRVFINKWKLKWKIYMLFYISPLSVCLMLFILNMVYLESRRCRYDSALNQYTIIQCNCNVFLFNYTEEMNECKGNHRLSRSLIKIGRA